MSEVFAQPLRELNSDHWAEFDGKNDSLREPLRARAPRDVRVPDGFGVNAEAIRLHPAAAGLDPKICATPDASEVPVRYELPNNVVPTHES